MVSNGHTVIGLLNTALPFDPVKDFTPVAHIATIPGIMVVPPDGGPKSVADLVAIAKANPAASTMLPPVWGAPPALQQNS